LHSSCCWRSMLNLRRRVKQSHPQSCRLFEHATMQVTCRLHAVPLCLLKQDETTQCPVSRSPNSYSYQSLCHPRAVITFTQTTSTNQASMPVEFGSICGQGKVTGTAKYSTCRRLTTFWFQRHIVCFFQCPPTLAPRRRTPDAPPGCRPPNSCLEECNASELWSPPLRWTAGIRLEGPATVIADSDMSSPISLVAAALEGGRLFIIGSRLRPASASHLRHQS